MKTKAMKTKYKQLGKKRMAELVKVLAWQIHILRGQDDWYINEIISRLYNK